ncbi:type II secretion system F family protein [Candidatus Saganbacteria bacterium]|nr:type II secretion system F family protein [Candidatus Saganbacteria bacterium]
MKSSDLLKQLSKLIKSGMPLNKALKILAVQTDKISSQKILKTSSMLEKGTSFSEAMLYSKLISKEVKCALKIAEENSFLDEAMLKASLLQEKKEKILNDFIKAISYPSIVFCVSIVCILFLIIFVMPAYSKIFNDFGCALPLVTQIVVSIPKYNYLIWPIGAILALLIFRSVRDPDLRLRLPYFGKIYSMSILSDLCYSLSYQLKSGVPFTQALRDLSDGIESKTIRASILKIITDIECGKSISSSFSEHKIFSGTLSQFLSVGEESGDVAQMIYEAGEQFSSMTEEKLKMLSIYVEPAATLFVGGIVGFVALAMLLPLFSIVNSLL